MGYWDAVLACEAEAESGQSVPGTGACDPSVLWTYRARARLFRLTAYNLADLHTIELVPAGLCALACDSMSILGERSI